MSEFGMTRKQRQLLSYLSAYFNEYGYSPSFQEMTDALGLHSKSGVHRLVRALEERGKILVLRNRARSIVPIGTDAIAVRLPVELESVIRNHALSTGISRDKLIIDTLAAAFKPVRILEATE